MIPLDRLDQLTRRYGELDELLCRPDVLSDRAKLLKLNKERSDLEPLISAFARYREVGKKITEDEEALADPELRELAQAELPSLTDERSRLEASIQMLLLPPDPTDKKNIILEIRSGEGGEEAALFAADLFRMYARYAENKKWNTSTATVAVFPEADEVDVFIDDKDLEISIAASGGPGGQGVNTTNSAVQVLHKPSGIIVKCQDERSQLKNKAKALKVLRSRLLESEREKQEALEAQTRRNMVSTGERSQKIRTYNFPQNRVTDHRIRLTLAKLDRVIEGDLDELVTALRTNHQADRLQAVGVALVQEKHSTDEGPDT